MSTFPNRLRRNVTHVVEGSDRARAQALWLDAADLCGRANRMQAANPTDPDVHLEATRMRLRAMELERRAEALSA